MRSTVAVAAVVTPQCQPTALGVVACGVAVVVAVVRVPLQCLPSSMPRQGAPAARMRQARAVLQAPAVPRLPLALRAPQATAAPVGTVAAVVGAPSRPRPAELLGALAELVVAAVVAVA